MKIFVSWSGGASQQIANFLHGWLQCIIQEADVWVSSQDIEKGQRWLSTVSSNLSETNFGIIVVTPENKSAPWLMFEAGALSKSLESRVTAFLCGLEHKDVAGTPLFQFQNTLMIRDEIFSAVRAMNIAASRPISEVRLLTIFDKFWPDFEIFYRSVSFASEATEKIDSEGDRLRNIENVLEELTRTLKKMQPTTKLNPFSNTLKPQPTVSYYENLKHGYGRGLIIGSVTPEFSLDAEQLETILPFILGDDLTIGIGNGELRITYPADIKIERVYQTISFLTSYKGVTQIRTEPIRAL